MSGYVLNHAGTLKRAGFIFFLRERGVARPLKSIGDHCLFRAKAADFSIFGLSSIAHKAFTCLKIMLTGFYQAGRRYWPALHFDWRVSCLPLQ